MSFPFVRTANGVSVIVSGAPYVVASDHPNYKILLQHIVNEDEVAFLKDINPIEKAVERLSRSEKVGRVTVEDGKVLVNGKEVNNAISRRILEFVNDGLPYQPLLRFLENLQDNPSNRSINELYEFLEHQALPITEDGHFLAYKTVRSDYYSKAAGSLTLISGRANASGHIYNGIGEKIACPRNEVDDVAGRTCSHGLHVGALAYAGPGGWYNSSSDKVVYVKVNPKDAVSVPSDHNAQKLRVCAYEVVEEYNGPLNSALYSTNGGVESYEDGEYDWDEDDDYEDDDELDIMTRERSLPENVDEFDTIEFIYRGTDGTAKTRYVHVQDVDDEHISGYSCDNPDDTWENLVVDETTYKTYRKEKMTGVSKLV